MDSYNIRITGISPLKSPQYFIYGFLQQNMYSDSSRDFSNGCSRIFPRNFSWDSTAIYEGNSLEVYQFIQATLHWFLQQITSEIFFRLIQGFLLKVLEGLLQKNMYVGSFKNCSRNFIRNSSDIFQVRISPRILAGIWPEITLEIPTGISSYVFFSKRSFKNCSWN